MPLVTLLDGGVGQELVTRSPDAPTAFFGTQVMVDHPGLVEAVHRDFLEAGATVATTNTYALHHDRLERTGWDVTQQDLVDRALAEVRAAVGDGKVAGSVGPLRWSYDPGGQPPHGEAVALYAELASRLAPGVDVILVETLASVAQVRAALEGARQTGKPVWIGVTVDDQDGSRLRSGEPLTDLALFTPDAWLANCSAPEAMPAALDVFARRDIPFGAYANGFVEITKDYLDPNADTSQLAKRDVPPADYAQHVLAWVRQGATIVGGCCEIGPAHIRAVRATLEQESFEIT